MPAGLERLAFFAGYAMQIVYNAHDYAKITMFRNIIMNKLIKPYDDIQN